jgi:hypothetical protein
MTVYIARGSHVWTASLDPADALVRCARQLRDRKEIEAIKLVRTSGDWSVSSMDGTLTSSEEIIEVEREEGDIYYRALEAIRDGISILRSAKPEWNRDIDALAEAEGFLDSMWMSEYLQD